MEHNLHKLIESLDILPIRGEGKRITRKENLTEARRKFRRNLLKKGIVYKNVVPNAHKHIKRYI